MAATSRPLREPVTLTCNHGHQFTTRAKSLEKTHCPTCRKKKVNTAVWVPARSARAGEPESTATDDGPDSPELSPLAPVDLIRDADPEHPEQPCAICHEPMQWSSGRTRLLCSCSGQVTFRLPSAVGLYHDKLTRREAAKREQSAVAARPNLDETRTKVELAGQVTLFIAEVNSLYRWAEWKADSKYDSDLAILEVTRSRLGVICDRARTAARLSDLDGLKQVLAEEAVRIASRWGNQAYPGRGWENLGYIHPSSVQHVRPSAPKRAQPAVISDAKRSALTAAGLPTVIDGEVVVDNEDDDDYEEDEAEVEARAERLAKFRETMEKCRRVYEAIQNERKRAAIAQKQNGTMANV